MTYILLVYLLIHLEITDAVKIMDRLWLRYRTCSAKSDIGASLTKNVLFWFFVVVVEQYNCFMLNQRCSPS